MKSPFQFAVDTTAMATFQYDRNMLAKYKRGRSVGIALAALTIIAAEMWWQLLCR